MRRAAIALFILAVFAGAAWYLTSPQFNRWARGRLVSQLEDITGGKVEIEGFRWNLSKLEFDLTNITIHGLEGPNEIPYAHADRLVLRVKILSFMQREIGLQRLQIERPVIHLIVYPDGHTNQPTPKAVSQNTGDPTQQLFALAINHAELNDGQLIFNEQSMPLDMSADNLRATMDYIAASHRFDGSVKFGALKAKYTRFLPVTGAAEVQFSLFPDSLQFSGVHIVSGKSKFDASGKLTNFLHPVVNMTYRASVDTKDLAQFTRWPELRGGTADISGVATYQSLKVVSQGKIVVHDADYRTDVMRLSNLDAAADFTFDDQKLVFSHIVGRVFGGIAKGSLVIDHWIASADPKAPPQTATGHLRVENVPAETAANAFTTHFLDFSHLKLAGTAQGNVDVRWVGKAARTVLSLDVSVVPPAQFAADELPVTGDLKGTLDTFTGRFRMDPMNVSLPDLRITATGVLGSTTEDLRLSLAANDLVRFRSLLVSLNQQNGALAELTGKMNFDGVVSGKLTGPTVIGKVQVADFTFPLALIMPAPFDGGAHRQAPPQWFHVDSASADVSYSQQGILVRNGAVQRGGAHANFDVSAGLAGGQLLDSSLVSAHVVMRDTAVTDLMKIAGYDYPITGIVSANFTIGGTKANPNGGGHVQLTNANVYGEPVKSASADIQLAQQEARITNFLAVHNGAQVTGSGAYNLKTAAFRFQVTGSNFQLVTIQRLANNRWNLAGLLNFNATGSGTVSEPIVNASAHLQNFVVNGQRVGDATLTAITQGDALMITARSNFQAAELSLDGTVKIREPLFPANLNIRFNNFDFMPYLQSALPVKIGGKAFSAGTITVQGPLKQPRDLTIKAEIPKLTADMQGVELHNSEPIELSVTKGIVRVDNFKLAGPDTQMSIRGTVDLNGEQRMRIRGDGRINLKLAQSFDPDLNSAGFADFNVSVGGFATRPTLQGEVRMTNGSVNLIDFPNGLSNINGSLVFTEDRVQVQSLTAHTGGGDIQIGGFATYSPGLSFNLTAQGHDIRLRYPQGVSSTANIDLKLTGTAASSTLAGDVTVTRFGFNSQFDLAVYLARTNRPAETPGSSALGNVHFNVHVMSTPELQVQSSLAKLAGNVDIRVRGTGANPVLLGRVNLTEGQVSFNGANYRLERGDVTFNNPTKTTPNIDVEATTRVRDYDITLGFHGELSHGLNTNYRSDPPLPQPDIINLLAFGRTREEAELASQGSSAMSETVSNAVLGQAINSAVSNRVQRLFGVSRIKIAPEVGSTQTNPTAQVTIEQQVSNKVTITYITSLTQSTQQSIFVEYNINREVSIIAGRDQYGVVSFDVRVRQRRR